jgi:hypothetical protein
LDFKALNQLLALAKQDPQQAMDTLAKIPWDAQSKEELLHELQAHPEMIRDALVSLGFDKHNIDSYSRQAIELLNKNSL